LVSSLFQASPDFSYIGALLAAPFADSLGRKWSIVVSCLVFTVGIALQTAAAALPVFVVGRVFGGLGIGLASTLVPLYQSECSPKWIRGAIISFYQWVIALGILISNVLTNTTKDRPNHSAYRIPIATQFIWVSILAGGMIFLPEVSTFVSFHSSIAYV